MHNQLMMHFQMIPTSMILTFSFTLEIAFSDFLATNIVFHKHILLQFIAVDMLMILANL